jgi:hypothetical protein
MRKRRRWLRWLGLLALAGLVVLAIPFLVIEGGCRPEATTSETASVATSFDIADAGYRRNEANTYFTFPEWYIVYSFEDFGRFLDHGSESGFKYGRHIAGFWRSFCTINRFAAGRYQNLSDVKTMIYVIGFSYSIEYAIKGAYENTIGRLFEWIRGPQLTPQDAYARAVLQDYAAFLYTIPWYKYPFRDKLNGLDAITAPTPSAARTAERDFALGTEYRIKIGYAALIQKALDVSNDDEPREIMFVVKTLPPEFLTREPRIRVNRALTPEWQLVLTPRYKDFTEIVKLLLKEGYPIAEIAGNKNILITAIAPDKTTPAVDGVRSLFSLALDAKPGFRRIGIGAKLEQLVPIARALEASGVSIEHFYDY